MPGVRLWCVRPYLTYGRQPKLCGATYTMPQRETVAGDALARSLTSNKTRMVLLSSLMRSLFGKHRVRVSSRTCRLQCDSSMIHAGMVLSRCTNCSSAAFSGWYHTAIHYSHPTCHDGDHLMGEKTALSKQSLLTS